jgi:hypothetical protein
MRYSGLIERVSQSVVRDAAKHRDSFLHASPFQHTVIDDFFEEAFAARLLADFPAFNPALARNEIYGGVWGKAVNTEISRISPAYDEMYRLMGSAPFLDLVSEISGIPDLLPDPALYGGGTHENLHGQDLDPHVDFNIIDRGGDGGKLHRRLNLIVYLNKGWKGEWGGSLEIHSNPRKPAENRISAYEPLFNRAVMFETNEYSWHGFPKIDLPEAERHRSRKSISIYLYTRERPAEEIAPPHGTFYVNRPLDPRFRAGYTLTEADEKDLKFQLDRRDKWIEKYQRMELDFSGELQRKNAYIVDILARVRAPLTGDGLQTGTSQGLYADGWVACKAAFVVEPLAAITAVVLRGWRPTAGEVTVRVRGLSVTSAVKGSFEIRLVPAQPIESEFTVEIECQPALEVSGDDRALGFILIEARMERV